ncbi:MAG: hypothetical protein AB1483_14265 [Candidatus Zixiibacteriota bacterium]
MSITLEQRELLELFCKKADEVQSSSIFRNGELNVGLNLKWKRNEPLVCRRLGPGRNDLLGLVTIVRQLYSPKESIYFRRIYNVVFEHLSSREDIGAEKLDRVKSAMVGFKGVVSVDAAIGINLGNRKLSTKDIINIWFNGNIFHSDLSKVKIYELLWKSPAGPMADFIFRSAIINLAHLMVFFSGLIRAEVFTPSQQSTE